MHWNVDLFSTSIRLTNASALPGETRNQEIVSHHLNVAVLWRNTKRIKTSHDHRWTTSLSERLIVFRAQHIGMEHSVLSCIMLPHARRLSNMSRCRSMCQKCELVFIIPRGKVMKVNGQYCWNILLSQRVLGVIKRIADDNLVIGKTAQRFIPESNC